MNTQFTSMAYWRLALRALLTLMLEFPAILCVLNVATCADRRTPRHAAPRRMRTNRACSRKHLRVEGDNRGALCLTTLHTPAKSGCSGRHLTSRG